jgi:hypothetical protein
MIRSQTDPPVHGEKNADVKRGKAKMGIVTREDRVKEGITQRRYG